MGTIKGSKIIDELRENGNKYKNHDQLLSESMNFETVFRCIDTRRRTKKNYIYIYIYIYLDYIILNKCQN